MTNALSGKHDWDLVHVLRKKESDLVIGQVLTQIRLFASEKDVWTSHQAFQSCFQWCVFKIRGLTSSKAEAEDPGQGQPPRDTAAQVSPLGRELDLNHPEGKLFMNEI